jgi:hypothetical protein
VPMPWIWTTCCHGVAKTVNQRSRYASLVIGGATQNGQVLCNDGVAREGIEHL